MEHHILNLAFPTPGDSDFYTRWLKIGNITDDFGDFKTRKKITILVVDHRVKVTDGLISKFPNLKYICTANTAHTHIQCDYVARKIEVVSLRGEVTFLSKVFAVPEFTFHLMLALARPSNSTGVLLRGKTLGIVGLGRIGKMVKSIAEHGFGMKCLYVDKQHKEQDWNDLFSKSDFVTIHLSENQSTIKLVGPKYLSLMQPHSFFINTARGSIVDERCLASMLKSSRICGAGVDVVEDTTILNEDVPNLIITDHIAGSTLDDRIRTDDFIVTKMYSILNKGSMN